MRTFTLYGCHFVLVEGDDHLFPSVLRCYDYLATHPSDGMTFTVCREGSCRDSHATYKVARDDEIEGKGFLDETRLYVIEPRDWKNRQLDVLLVDALSDTGGSYYILY
jgi:hypothetical protein